MHPDSLSAPQLRIILGLLVASAVLALVARWGHRRRRDFIAFAGSYFSMFTFVLAAVLVLNRVWRIPGNQAILGSFGAVVLAAATLRAWFFWDHPRALWLRNLAGDTVAQAVYM